MTKAYNTEKIYTVHTPLGNLKVDLTSILNLRLDPEKTTAKLRKALFRLNISISDKNVLWKLTEFTVRVGDRVLYFSQRILEIIAEIAARVPMTICATIVGVTLKAMLTAVPVLGWIVGPLIGSLLTFGLQALGLTYDLVPVMREVMNDKLKEFGF